MRKEEKKKFGFVKNYIMISLLLSSEELVCKGRASVQMTTGTADTCGRLRVEFGSQHPCRAAHNTCDSKEPHPPPLTSEGHTNKHTYINKISL